jgi:hypothetical protein
VCIRLAAASDKVYQLLAHGRWFSPGTLASSTTKTGHHDIAEILLKHNKSNNTMCIYLVLSQQINKCKFTNNLKLDCIDNETWNGQAPASINLSYITVY